MAYVPPPAAYAGHASGAAYPGQGQPRQAVLGKHHAAPRHGDGLQPAGFTPLPRPQQPFPQPALPNLVPKQSPVYKHNGKKYESLGELQAAVSAVHAPFAEGRQLQGAAAMAKMQLERITSLLEEEARFKRLVQGLFMEYAGEDKKLQQHEARDLMATLGVLVGIANPLQVFGDVNQMFFRFDFSGDSELDEVETEHLVKFILRNVRDRLAPPPNVPLCHLPRKQLGDQYDVVRQLGQGGQGMVYLVRKKTADGFRGQERVVKFFSKALAQVPLDDIKEEFGILKQLDHPRIAKVIEMFEDNANVYVVSEPYFGGDLTTLLAKAGEHGVQPTHHWIGRIFKQVVEGVAHLHSKHIMHCDLKEPNVMIAQNSDWHEPHVVIIDFGMAKDFSGAREGGTPGYMPPEVWQWNLWTAKGDVFSLAIIFWSVFTGRPWGPFYRPDAPPWARIREATLNSSFDVSRLPPGLQQLTLDMAAKDFKLRPTSTQVLNASFFQNLAQHTERLDPNALELLKKAAERKSIQNLVAQDLLATENLGQLRHLNDVFRRLDKDNSGTVEPEEARQALGQLGMNKADVDKLVQALIGEQGVHYTDFVTKLFLAQRGVREEELARVFQGIDTDRSGTLDRKEIEALLRRPDVSRLMEGRSASEIIAEMDLNGDGVIDFGEFRRAMLAESVRHGRSSWKVGDVGRYFSQHHQGWLQCCIIAVDAETGSVQINIKPGAWLTVEVASRCLIRGCRQWQRGDRCQIFSPPHQRFIEGVIQDVDPARDSAVVDVRPGVWTPCWHLAEPLHAQVQKAAPPAMVEPIAAQGMMLRGPAWRAGEQARYFSKRQGAIMDCTIAAVDAATGAVMIDIKKEYWMHIPEQQEVLSRR
eukprot:TRINITY_DN9674_c0_g1_i3.p1 TRINITY_DN9674_c0_g1~~TRINITY_DN9674_c0_g1_i3.p1  ORF type:complete len:869 (+),score=215.93 TRINITY_DN9674_c0_g1_i3:26-2632(+)